MMHGRMPVIAERDIGKLKLRGHGSPHRKQDGGPQHNADAERGTKPRHDRHAQDRPGRDLRRMRRSRAVAMGVAVAMSVVMMVVVWNHG
jgi:hypothetical protein